MRRSVVTFWLCTLLFALPTLAVSQTPSYADQVKAIQDDARVKAANEYIDRNHDGILREWVTITEINAPSKKEQERARYLESLLRKYKVDVRYDAAGNLIATRKGTGGGPVTVFDAHMDTVFQPGLKIKATIRDGRVYAPGIGDDTRNIEALLATIRALDTARIKTRGDLIFLFTTDEEAGMTGAKSYTKENKGKVDYYVALDGGYEGFTYAGIGINWYRHHFIGPGGHTRSRTPPYSASLPLARAITRIYELKVPSNPSSNLNIGMLGGSEVPNAKAADAWFTVDLRSTDNAVIADLDKKIAAILDEEAKRAGMTVKTDIISTSPAAILPGNRESKLVKIAEAVHRAMGFDPPISNTGSNNSSAALLQGITSISTGAGPCSDSHALTENCEIEPLYKGVKKIMLLAISLAGLEN
ncbi:MAG TPA: M20/M25/M40 family metallo-hydrolase [Pyrinomonadaceae bacterium]|jgi:Acetylornithine deacetylase/Succinyl-diaminopimelate desuccinylase and related deacylases|nr:M20/M25/M40 family metallo-hydrolase [Pyrinomonadaceae bacterium]